MSKASVAAVKIVRMPPTRGAGAGVACSDLVAVEEPLEIRIGYGPANDRQRKSLSVTMRTPGHDFELTLGFLFAEGLIQSQDDITQIKYCSRAGTVEDEENIVRVELKETVRVDLKNMERNFYTTSSCGVCGKVSIEAAMQVCARPTTAAEFTVSPEVLYRLPDKLREKQNIFEHTGGLHAAAVFDLEGNLLLTREDVGRHNALDKLVGAALGAGLLPLAMNILLLSGRASFELMQKAARAGLRLVCAVGAPSSLAVQMAREYDMALVGFLRDRQFNIYFGEQHIIP